MTTGSTDDIDTAIVNWCLDGFTWLNVERGYGNTSGIHDIHLGGRAEVRRYDNLLALSVDVQVVSLIIRIQVLIIALQLRRLIREDNRAGSLWC